MNAKINIIDSNICEVHRSVIEIQLFWIYWCICYKVWTSVYISDNIITKMTTWWQNFKNNWSSMRFHDRVLTLVPLKGMEVLPTIYPPKLGVMRGLCESQSPRRVMMTVGCLKGTQVDIVDAVILEVYEWLDQYNWHHDIFQ